MKQLRKHLITKDTLKDESKDKEHQSGSEDQLEAENGLVIRQVPMLRKLMYDANSTDYMIYKRRKLSSMQKEEHFAAIDMRKKIQLDSILEQQRKKMQAQLTSESQVSEDQRMASIDDGALANEDILKNEPF